MTGKSMEQKSLPRNTAKRDWKHHFWIQLLSFTDKFSLDTRYYTKHFNYFIYI